MEIFFLLFLGLATGSFLGMLTWRTGKGLPPTGRSICPHCEKGIFWYDNIPVLSFILLRGRCRHCNKRVSWRYPAIEITTASVFIFSFLISKSYPGFGAAGVYAESLGTLYWPFLFIFLTGLLAIAFIDFTEMFIPDSLLLLLGGLVVFANLALPSPLFFENLFWAFISFSFLLSLFLLTKGKGMGFGDVKLAFLLGLLLGRGVIIAFFLAFLTGAAVGAILILIGKARLGKPIPFGPFLVVSAILSFWFAEEIFKWYANLP